MYKLGKWNSDMPQNLEQEAENLLKNSRDPKELIDVACHLKNICDNGKKLLQDYTDRCLRLRRLLVMKVNELTKRSLAKGNDCLDFGGEQLLCMHATEVLLGFNEPSVYHAGITLSAFKRMIKKASKPRHWTIVIERFRKLSNSQMHKMLLAKAERLFLEAVPQQPTIVVV